MCIFCCSVSVEMDSCAEAILAQELDMPMSKQMPSKELGAEVGLDLGAGGAAQDAKEPMVLSILKGNVSAATADLGEEELCRGYPASVVKTLLDRNEGSEL